MQCALLLQQIREPDIDSFIVLRMWRIAYCQDKLYQSLMCHNEKNNSLEFTAQQQEEEGWLKGYIRLSFCIFKQRKVRAIPSYLGFIIYILIIASAQAQLTKKMVHIININTYMFLWYEFFFKLNSLSADNLTYSDFCE